MNDRRKLLRLPLLLIVLLASLFGPSYFLIIAIIVGNIAFPFFIEGLIGAIIHDSIFGVSGGFWFETDTITTLCAVLIMLCTIMIRRFIRRMPVSIERSW